MRKFILILTLAAFALGLTAPTMEAATTVITTNGTKAKTKTTPAKHVKKKKKHRTHRRRGHTHWLRTGIVIGRR